MKKFALLGAMALTALMVGCSSTQTRDDACADKPSCTATACTHENTAFKCPNCKPGEPCCAGCAKKAAEMCPDCKGKAAMACPDCKDGKMCAKCEAMKSAKACPDCKDGQKCAKCAAG